MIQTEFVKELPNKVIYVNSFESKYTVIECERLSDGAINPIPVRKTSRTNLNDALEVAEEWAGQS